MTMYILLLIYILLVGLIISNQNVSYQKRRIRFSKCAFVAIFLLYSLRSSSVGRDLPGYERMYGVAAQHDWFDFSYVYFESGYILLMKICNSLNLSFQWFLTIVNFIILYPIYRFIKKYSTSPLLSTVIFVCYMFFEFNLTGIRQAIAMSIVLMGYMLMMECKKIPLVWYVVAVILASYFHSGALIALIYVPFHFVNKTNKYVPIICISAIVVLVGRSYIMSYIKEYFMKDSMNASAGLYIGANFVFVCMLAIVFVWADRIRENKCLQRVLKTNDTYADKQFQKNHFNYPVDAVNTKMFLLSILVLLMLGSDTSVRSYMFLNQVILVQLPRCIDTLLDERSKSIARIFCVVFFIGFFYATSLRPNPFDIVPYKFFWQ